MSRGIPSLGQWSVSGQTQTAATIIFAGIPPWPSVGPRFLYDRSTKNWLTAAGGGGAVTHVTTLSFTSPSDLKKPTFMRPLNWTYITTAAAAGATSLVIAADPGVYSTNFNYPLGGGATYPYNAADNAIATNDYCCYQLADGMWQFAKITGVSTLTLTVAALPSPTGTGNPVAAGSVLFWFGIVGDTDPNTGAAHPNLQPPASATTTITDLSGLCSAVHPGDPLLYYDANATSAATEITVSGYYGKF